MFQQVSIEDREVKEASYQLAKLEARIEKEVNRVNKVIFGNKTCRFRQNQNK